MWVALPVKVASKKAAGDLKGCVSPHQENAEYYAGLGHYGSDLDLI